MIEAQACSYVPIVPVPLVLHVGCGLDIPMLVRKLKGSLSARIKLRRILNRILQCLVNGSEEAVHTGFPIMMALVAGEVGAQIAFAVAAVLGNNHRRCGWI